MLINLDSKTLSTLTQTLQVRMIDCSERIADLRGTRETKEYARRYWTGQREDARLALETLRQQRIIDAATQTI